jgi:outer membrane protein OmpA-like peptidoglycan-associated protein
MRWLLIALVACSSPKQRVEPPAPVTPDAMPDAMIDAIAVDAARSTMLVPDAARQRVIVTTTDGCGFILDFVYFDSNSSVVSERQRPALDANAELLVCGIEEGITKIEVQGHADDKEKDALRLSEDRAVHVANYLTRKGVPASALSIVGYGNAFPIDQRKTAAARAKNRRVGLLILERKRDE